MNNKLNKINLPWIEDTIVSYHMYAAKRLFPNKKNKLLVNLISFLHLLGMWGIVLGPFLPSKFLGIYLIYIFYVLITYKLFNGTCFMTLITNKLSGNNESPLYIRMSTVYILIINNVLISLIGYLFPKYSLYNFIKFIINSLEKI